MSEKSDRWVAAVWNEGDVDLLGAFQERKAACARVEAQHKRFGDPETGGLIWRKTTATEWVLDSDRDVIGFVRRIPGD